MSVKISDSWIKHLEKEFQKDYFFEIIKNVKHEYSNYTCFPKGNDIFKAFDLCSFEKIKVIIVGQDPYHGDNQANGLCFSVNKGIDYPPSLKNIFKEIHNNFGLERINPDFSDLARQGVLLLNSVLTVRRKFPGSHKYVGWETFTDRVLEIISEKKNNLVFMLWGNYAKNKKKFILNKNHLILESGHPSPLSANKGYWFNNNHFSTCNDYLNKNNIETIKWV